MKPAWPTSAQDENSRSRQSIRVPLVRQLPRSRGVPAGACRSDHAFEPSSACGLCARYQRSRTHLAHTAHCRFRTLVPLRAVVSGECLEVTFHAAATGAPKQRRHLHVWDTGDSSVALDNPLDLVHGSPTAFLKTRSHADRLRLIAFDESTNSSREQRSHRDDVQQLDGWLGATTVFVANTSRTAGVPGGSPAGTGYVGGWVEVYQSWWPACRKVVTRSGY
jgi:hypothetical protein